MEEISLRDIINIILRGKWIIAAAAVISLVLAGIGSVYMVNGSQTAKIYISLNFDGIGNGLNPDGTKFDSNLVKSPTVIQDALDTLQIDNDVLKVDQIRRNMSVEPVVPNDIVARIETLRKEGQDFTYFPNEFVVSLKMPKGVDRSIGGKLLDAVVDSYSKYFYDIYSERAVLANSVGELDYGEYDYTEISTVIHNQINIISSYLAAKANESNGFRSKQTGLAFVDIQESIDIIDKVDLSRMDSIIGAYNLTKDKEKLIKSYEYRIKINELNKSKKVDEAAQSKDMMNNYKREQNSILIPGLSTSGNDGIIEQQDNTSYYDTLAERATNAGVQASNDIHDNEYLIKEIEKLKSDTVSVETKEAAVK